MGKTVNKMVVIDNDIHCPMDEFIAENELTSLEFDELLSLQIGETILIGFSQIRRIK